ncbi:MAG: hypothetical protein OHK0031_03040 [Anaerolineales bacterium]
MKKILSIALFGVLILSLLALNVTPGAAQGVTPTATPEITPGAPLESGIIPFDALGSKDVVMRGPFDSAEVRYTPPSSWQLDPGASLTLNLEASFSSKETFDQRSSGAALEVTVNDVLVQTLFINQSGVQSFEIPLPPAALISYRSDGRHTVRFFLDAAYDCRFPQETSIVLRSTSFLNLPHTLVSPSTDLTILPRPFYQDNSFLPEPVYLVTADKPSAQELQAAMTVSAAFGRMTLGGLALPLVTVSALTAEQKNQAHLILVGNASLLKALPQLILPEAGAKPGEGLAQMAVSPWNSARAVLYLGGADAAGTLKAAQALTFGSLQPGALPSQSIISEVNPQTLATSVSADRSFGDLGYPTRTVTGYGVSSLEYRFYLPPGQVPGSDPYLNLVYSHSALVDLGNSGLVISLNDQRIGSVQFTADTAKQINNLKVALQPEALRPGDNKLVIQADMRPTDFCSDFSTNGLWFTANAESLIHLPLIPAELGDTTLLTNLSLFPFPFTSTPSLDGTTLIVSAADPASWNIASQISALLGRRATGKILTPGLAFADALTDEIRQKSLIVVGQPAQIPLVAEMADAMPAPFEANSNLAVERSLPVTYRLPEGASLGYIELFPSPWNSAQTVMTFLGSTSEGLGWTLAAMTDPLLRGRVTGNYAVINRQQVLATDTRGGATGSNLSATAVPGAVPTLSMPAPAANASAHPGWLLPAILTLSVLTVLLLFVVAFGAARKNKK